MKAKFLCGKEGSVIRKKGTGVIGRVIRGAALGIACSALCVLPCIFSVSAQNYDEDRNLFDMHQVYSPEAESYIAFSKAAFLDKLGQQAVVIGDQGVPRDRRDESRRYIMEAVELDPRSSFLHTELAKVAIRVNDIKTARDELSSALALDPDNSDAHYWLGYLKYGSVRNTGDSAALGDAMNEFRAAIRYDPENISAQYYLASLSYELGDYKQAVESYSEMVRLRPYDPELRYRLGMSYSEVGDRDRAIESFKATTMIRDDHIKARFSLANLYTRQNMNREGIEECLKILGYAPESQDVKLLLAQLYIAAGDFDRAISLCDDILRSKDLSNKSLFAETYYRRGMAYKGKRQTDLADKDFGRSVDIYRLVLEKESENIGANYDIAMVYDAKGDRNSAERHLLRHIELRPNEPNAYNYLGYMLAENGGDLQRAIGYIQKALQMEPRNGAFMDSLGWAYFRLGRIDDSIETLEKAIGLMPGDSEIYKHLGEAYLKKKDEGGRMKDENTDYIKKAIEQWEKALAIKPSDATLKQRLAKLYESQKATGAK